MTPILNNPVWIKKYTYEYKLVDDISPAVFDAINKDLQRIQSNTPHASIIICAWNEEVNIVKTIASLSAMQTKYPIEIIVVNNNSTDRTQEVLNKLNVKIFFQPVQGWGPARQMGLEQAIGKYILLADADCIYPDCWAEDMIAAMEEPNVVCILGKYAFIAEKGYPRWKLFIMEMLKNILTKIRSYKRPYLNAYGMSMGFVREYGIKAGFVAHKIRGEDGRLCYDLMPFGKIKLMKGNATKVWTSPRALQRDGGLNKAVLMRIIKEIKRLHTYFKPLPAHDTKTSVNK